jgi:hypothetical protein
LCRDNKQTITESIHNLPHRIFLNDSLFCILVA